ncbi:glycosyltransferase family 2 protein [Paraburkholderia caballeronis]|uniref:glycosyltransferase family 2 protein n=1 Tax=Paraburkholderia caballeronis TaxID=416943 RepID=UPI0010650491|nr:glycosyltransferase family 2 protein [Paraburkholderia caballeronis]TDV11121.1 nucleotidyltransferase-like protein [Paraburkholderia caballeronis]TDV14189.1 nucleotidyltransferase-like protein [Paraburkholderia caballeronis]TDV23354.1 nucleotidyltransferase-like protein [Paraburkholderia caballeronis]
MLNIVIPMAGAGSRFARAGYADPKPLIPIHGVPMIRVVINNLTPAREHRFIFICQREHDRQYGLRDKLTSWAPGAELILLDGLTDGAACTVLAAKDLIDNDDPLMIANSDQYIDCGIGSYLDDMDQRELDGLIMTMKADDPKWSFVGLDAASNVTQVVEKKVISDEATVGIYNFRRGRDFISATQRMIQANERVNNEFYVAPAYNPMIAGGARIGIFNIGSEGAGMYGLGIPADLDAFLALDLSRKAVEVVG